MPPSITPRPVLTRALRPAAGAALGWLVCLALPASVAAAVTLHSPAGGSQSNDSTPAYGGAAGDEPGDSPTVVVRIYGGPAAAGDAVQTLSATRTGASWSAEPGLPLADGTYTVQAEQADGTGGTQLSEPVTFAIDTLRPDTSVVSGPAGFTNDATPEFAFASTEAGSFLCSLSAGGQASGTVFSPCSSPRALAPLADGPYVFEAVAVDAASNQDDSPATRTFRVDTVGPRTTLVAGPGDTTATDTAFLFSSNEVASFSCRLDAGAWTPCSSPQSYSGLALGPHKFEVRATDRAGNEGGAATHSWQVLRPGVRIPATAAQAVALAQELVELRDALKRTRLRRISRRAKISLAGFDAVTAGTVELSARARPKRRPRGVRFAFARHSIPAAGRYALVAKVTRQGRRLARRRARLPIELRLAFTDLAGRSLWATTTTTMVR